jgi:hypothetical protein
MDPTPRTRFAHSAPASSPMGKKQAMARSVRDEEYLLLLMEEVVLARTEVHRGRGLPPSPSSAGDQSQRMQHLARTLEAFADAASTAGVPLPYRYRDEIRLYQALYPFVSRRVTS